MEDLIERARRVFGDEKTARDGLGTPNPALGGERPSDLLDREADAGRVASILLRIEHGVYE